MTQNQKKKLYAFSALVCGAFVVFQVFPKFSAEQPVDPPNLQRFDAHQLFNAIKPKEPLETFATQMLDAYRRGDVNQMYGGMAEREKKLTGMDRKSFEKAVGWAKGAMSGYEPDGQATLKTTEDGREGILSQPYRSSSGEEFTMELHCFMNAKGPVVYWTYTLLGTGVVAKYREKFSHEPEPLRNWLAMLHGLDHEKPFFEAINFTRFVDSETETRPTELAGVRLRAARFVEKTRQKLAEKKKIQKVASQSPDEKH